MNKTFLNTIGEKVIVKGGGSSGGGSATPSEKKEYTYIAYSSPLISKNQRNSLKLFVEEYSESGRLCENIDYASFYLDTTSPTYAKIDFNKSVTNYNGTYTVKELLIMDHGFTEEDINALPTVSEEEYYTLQ